MTTRHVKLYARKQQASKYVTDPSAELKQLAAESQFGAFLNNALRDRLCRGLSDIC